MFELRPYQQEHLAFHLGNRRSLNLSDPGTGKTPTACLYIYAAWAMEKKKTAFVMPKSIMAKNKDELVRFTNFKPEEIAIVSGQSLAEREKIYKDKSIKVFIIGGDTFSNEFEKMDFGCLVVDEMHLIYKTHSSKRVQGMYIAARMKKLDWILMMTGTPIDGRLDSIFPALKVLCPKYYGSYQSFMATHAIKDEYGTVISWQGHDRLNRILGTIAVKTRFEEAYPDAHKPVIIRERCNMDPLHKSMYNEFEAEALLELEDRFIDGTQSGGVHLMRCRQILSAPESIGLKDIELGKDESLKIHLTDIQEAKGYGIVFSAFVEEQERIKKICDEMGLRSAIINGSSSAKNRSEIDRAFRNKELDIVIGSPQCMSVGYNWEHADTVIFTSTDYLWSTFKQAYQRADRGTRKFALKVISLYYDTEVEHKIWSILGRKKKDAEQVGW